MAVITKRASIQPSHLAGTPLAHPAAAMQVFDPPAGAARALVFFCQYVLQHGLVESQIGYQLL